MANCPDCGNEVRDDAIFCDSCGKRLQSPPEAAAPPAEAAGEASGVVICPVCEAQNIPGEAFCLACGSSLEGAQPAPAPAPEPAPASEPAPAPAPVSGGVACPVCGVSNDPDDLFCSSCGASLKEVPAPEPAPPEPAPAPEPAPPEPAPAPEPAPSAGGPYLKITASGARIPLPGVAEIRIGREDPVSSVFPEVDLTPHGGDDAGVSRLHAKITVEGGSYFIEDLDSTNYTFLNKDKLDPKVKQLLADGDEIRCGKLLFTFHVG